MLSLGGRRSSVAASLLLLHGVGYAFKDASTHGLLADLVDAHGAEGSYAMAFALADVADSAGYIVGLRSARRWARRSARGPRDLR